MVFARLVMTLITLLLIAHAWFAPGQAAEPVPPPGPRGSPEAGRALVEVSCASCHAVGPAGDSPHPDAPAFRDLHRAYPVESLEEALGEGIMVGHPDMPEFVLDPGQVGDVIAWLKSLEEAPAE